MPRVPDQGIDGSKSLNRERVIAGERRSEVEMIDDGEIEKSEEYSE
jgi:hypothetical protein